MEVAVRDINEDFDDTSLTEPSVNPASTPASLTGQPLAEVLAALGNRVAPIVLARERLVPTASDYAELFVEGGLVRGRVLSSVGMAATSVALGLIAQAVASGSWVAMVDVPSIGLDAACELGLALERVVAIDTIGRASQDTAGRDTAGRGDQEVIGAEQAAQRWADVVAAAADGFDVMVVRVPEGLRSATVRKVVTRLQQRGVVMVVLGDPRALVCDGVIDSDVQTWSGLGAGWGHLTQRSVDITASGRRLPGRRCRTVMLPSGEGQAQSAHAPIAVFESELSTAS